MTTIQFPASPAIGDVYTFNQKSWVYDGVKWTIYVNTRPVTISTDVTASSSAPSNPVNGMLWLNTTSGKFFIYYSGVWKDITGDVRFNEAAGVTGYVGLPVGNIAQRPQSPAVGAIRINSETNYLETYYSNNWTSISYLGRIVATGGTVTTLGDYKIHTFTTSGSFIVDQAPAGGAQVQYLVVAGGGGGARYGGGGAGGCLYGDDFIVESGSTYSVQVGAGGATTGASSSSNGANGGPTVFSSFSVAGGGGGSWGSNTVGNNGGSGGGGGNGEGVSGRYTNGGLGNTPATNPSQGNNGGRGTNNEAAYLGGGGGGAGAAGEDATQFTKAGNGGIGIQWYDGNWYAGGGGGASFRNNETAGSASLGGGGPGATYNSSFTISNTGAAGVPYTGGGGGAPYNGGSGVVIVRYRYQ